MTSHEPPLIRALLDPRRYDHAVEDVRPAIAQLGQGSDVIQLDQVDPPHQADVRVAKIVTAVPRRSAP